MRMMKSPESFGVASKGPAADYKRPPRRVRAGRGGPLGGTRVCMSFLERVPPGPVSALAAESAAPQFPLNPTLESRAPL
jgi:hypothetical protein